MVALIQPSFSGGELSPGLQAQADTEQYVVSVDLMRNFMCHTQGGAMNRPGTEFIYNFADTPHRLLPFQFSREQAYCLVFVNLKMYVIKDGGVVITAPDTPFEMPTPYTTDDLAGIQISQSADVAYLTHESYFPRKLSRLTETSWSLVVMPLLDGPWDTSTNTQSVTPSARTGAAVGVFANNLFTAEMAGYRLRLGYANPADPSNLEWDAPLIVSSVDPFYASVTTFGTPEDIIIGYEYVTNNTFKNSFNGWRTVAGSVTFSARYLTKQLNAATEIRQQVSVPRDTAMEVRVVVSLGTDTVQTKVGSTDGGVDLVNNSTPVAVGPGDPETVITNTFNTGNSSVIWISVVSIAGFFIEEFSVGAADLTTSDVRTAEWLPSGGFPVTSCFFEQRLVMAGTTEKPQTIWHSETGDFERYGFSTPIQDNDSITYTLDSKEVNDIKWIVPLKELLVGTSGSEWSVSRGPQTAAMTPSSHDVSYESGYGSASMAPLLIGDSAVFVQRGRRKIRDLRYSLEARGYIGNDLTIMADHLFQDKTIVDWAYAEKPFSIIWCVLDDGTLAAMTYNREFQVFGWHRHDTDGFYENVTVIADEEKDTVYFTVKRTIDGSEKRYVEVLTEGIRDRDVFDFFYVDSGLSYNNPSVPITTVSGLDHLEGKEVSILADGSVEPKQTVTGGQVVLRRASKVIIIGLPITSDIRTLNLAMNDGNGDSQSRQKDVSSVTAYVRDTRELWTGEDFDKLYHSELRTQADGEAPQPLYTGPVKIPIDFDPKVKATLAIRNEDPLPVTILSLIPDVEVSDEV